MSFKTGEKVVRVLESNFYFDPRCINDPTPEINQIVTVNDINFDMGIYWLGFEEMPQDVEYPSIEYRKLSEVSGELSEEIMEKVLTSIPELV